MLLQAALIQIAFITSVKDALVIAAPVCFLMDLQMLFQIAPGRKLLRAEFTLERSLARVNPLMPDEVAHLTECLRAAGVRALVWFLLIVHTCMLLK